jgi:hypothetical protein|tara:strand:+ start:21 stop:881 length:861 start_codon:yes stop_codon:yes gene_type:complete
MKELMENWRDYEKEVVSEAAAAAAAPLLMPGAVQAALGVMAAEFGAVVSGAGAIASGVVAPVLAGTAVGTGAGIEAIHQVTGMSREKVLNQAILGAMSIADLVTGAGSAQKYHKAVTQDAIRNAVKPVLAMAATEVAAAIEDSPLSDAEYGSAVKHALKIGGLFNSPEPPKTPKEPWTTKQKVAAAATVVASPIIAGGVKVYQTVKDNEREAALASQNLSTAEVEASLKDAAAGGAATGSGSVVQDTDNQENLTPEQRRAALPPIQEAKEIIREEVVKFFSNRRKN